MADTSIDNGRIREKMRWGVVALELISIDRVEGCYPRERILPHSPWGARV
jgi:hypothetical protein